MIALLRCNAISNDPRVKKYLNYIEEKNIDYHILGWDRNEENLELRNCTFFKRKSGYNVGGIKAAWNRILWMWFCFKELSRIKPNFIHGCDLDSAFPAVMYKIFRNRRVKVLFDVFDWFSATLYNQPKIITLAFKAMESLTTKHSDHILICEKEREDQIPYDVSDKIDILPNIPMVRDESTFKYKDKSLMFPNENITISYVGGLYGERFLDELLDIAEKGYVNLLIAGFGDDRIEKRCVEISKKENVKYLGGVSYELGLHIAFHSDVIYAMYCKTNPNHIYAAPNKYYEAMLLGKPIITTEGTIVGEKVKINNTGFVVNEDKLELENLLLALKSMPEVILQNGENAKKLWETEFSTYTIDFLQNKYNNYIFSD